jgi:tetratricopeptide (TPR) repeat protein
MALGLALCACSSNTKFAVTPGAPEVTWSSGSRKAPASQTRATQPTTEEKDEELAKVDKLYAEAVAERQQGNLDEAARLYRQALALCETKRGRDHADVASILNNLAGVEAAQGNYGEALPLLERAVSIRQNALGEGDPATAQSMNNLALLYAARGDVDLAEPLYRRSLAVLEKGNQASRADLEQVLENYAALLRDTGRDSEADEMDVRVRIIRAGRGAVPE